MTSSVRPARFAPTRRALGAVTPARQAQRMGRWICGALNAVRGSERALGPNFCGLPGARALALDAINQKIIHLLAGLELQYHPARLLASTGPRFGRV